MTNTDGPMAVEESNPFPGVWRICYGQACEPTLLDYSGVAPAAKALEGMGAGHSALVPQEIIAYRSSGRTVVQVPLEPEEKLYGFGLQYQSVEHRGQLFDLRVDHYKGRDDGRTHAPVPFYVSSRGYGLFINAAAKLSVYAGHTHRKERHPEIRSRRDPDWRPVAVSSILEVALWHDGVEVLLFAGPGILDAVKRFNLYCGGGCLPPKWGLGFWHRTPLDYTAGEVEEEVDAFAQRGFPLDVIGLEPGWHSSCYPTTFEWHSKAFPDPATFVSRLADRNVRVNLWENCFVHPDCELGKTLEPLSGSHTGSWGGYCPDLSMPEARTAIADQHTREHVSIGVSGYKLDECDDDNWLFPDYAAFPSGIPGETLHQVYGVLFQRATTEMFRRSGRRTYGQVRAGNAGTVSFPYVIYNDCYDHREYITGLCSASISGVLFTPEARNAKTSEEWLRRIQATCLSPLAQLNAWASGTKPWNFPDVAEEVRQTLLLRTRLIPYLYTAFSDYRRSGVPPFRAMILDFVEPPVTRAYEQGELDDTENPYSQAEIGSDAPIGDLSDQYMMGPSILVAPLFAGESSRSVRLPPGRWYDFYTGVFVGDGEPIEVSAEQKEIPLYVRDGGIIPMYADAYTTVPAAGAQTPIEIRHYGTAEGRYELYDDDGDSYDFEAGVYRTWLLQVEREGARGAPSGSVGSPLGPYASGYGPFSWRFMTADA